jgi:predicted ATPase
MDGKRFIQQLLLQNFLSYAGAERMVELLPLNVLIGPNASGKSNLIEALAVLRATATDLSGAIRQGGGIGDYIWQGARTGTPAAVGAVVEDPNAFFSQLIHYKLRIAEVSQRLEVVGELIARPGRSVGPDRAIRIEPEFYYHLHGGSATIAVRVFHETREVEEPIIREIQRQDLIADQSILSQRRDPDLYPELTYLGTQFGRIAIYQEWSFGRHTVARRPQRADLPSDHLLPDAANLGLVLNELQHRSETRRKLLHYLQKFYESAEYISTKITGGTVQIYIEEKGRREPIPATRLSDGTLRYLSLLAILCHPDPPPLICIEEPELGMHPDVLPTIAELLVDASQRTQLVVTTHSDVLVSALSDTPEAIVVCEPSPEGTQLRRLDRESLSEWLKKYSLGELWRMGEIGGTRW